MAAPKKPHRPTEADYRRLGKWRVNVRVSAHTRDELRRQAKESGYSMGELVEFWVEMHPFGRTGAREG